LVQVIDLYMARFRRQAAVDDEQKVAYLKALVVVLRFIQNQLPRRPGSAAAFQSDPDGRVQPMAGKVFPHRVSGTGGDFQHGRILS
jgi:hypothetical protein